MGEMTKQVLIQTFVAKPTIKRFKRFAKGVLGRLARCDVMPLNTGVLCPGKNCMAGSLGPIIGVRYLDVTPIEANLPA